MVRVSDRKGDVFLLRMPHEIGEGCKVIITRALSRVKNEKLKKLTEVRLWEFAGLLNIFNLRFTEEIGRKHAHELGFYLQLFSRFDPFLLLDDFRSDNPEHYMKGFPWHPHRGIETITYVLYGDVEHGDSLGNKGIISSDDVQWMTAGSGIIHQEMPNGDEKGLMYGFQLWANLPSSHKMMDPRYRDVK